jgi:hypothetical protein
LEAAVESASTPADRARAHYDLALFQDNNSREAEAIPHYEAALKLGLSGERKAQCLAWLASSFCKTRKFDRARRRAQAAREATSDAALLAFLNRLEVRIKRDEVTADLAKLARLLLREARRGGKPDA